MDFETILLDKKDGGLGLISIKVHTIAKVGILLLWVAHDGDHTLQAIAHAKVGDLSLKRWVVYDYSWLLVVDKTKPLKESVALTFLCKAWIRLKPFILPSPPVNFDER